MDVSARSHWAIRRSRTSWCLMSALMPPKHDLRGGRVSDDSFAMSSSILIPSTIRRFFATEHRQLQWRQWPGLVRELSDPITVLLAVGRNFLRILDMVEGRLLDIETRFVLVVDRRALCDAAPPHSTPPCQTPECRDGKYLIL